MDVTLVLTHRCNLDCHYCYAGEHVRKDMDDATMERALALLWADREPVAQLSFFGGEPFLARPMLRRAVERAREQAEARGVELRVQCTTNGTALRDDDISFIVANRIHTTVSIDGVREAHEQNRPTAGGDSSFDRVTAGLRALVAAGAAPGAMMVVTPETASFLYRSVVWLWDQGVHTVRCNLELSSGWDAADRRELREELVTVGWELLARRLRGQPVSFEPFQAGMNAELPASKACGGETPRRARTQVVVATGGHLYPCAPMVGEDRPDGPEAALRIGHLDDGPTAALAAARAGGVGCERGKGCACAAYLETGDRWTGGPVGRWYGAVCREIGAAVAAGLLADRRRAALEPRDADGPGARWKRRTVMVALAASAGGLALGGAAMLRAGLLGDAPRGTCGGEAPPIEDLQPAGAISAPTRIDQSRDMPTAGELVAPPPMPLGGVAAPEPITDGTPVDIDVTIDGMLAPPPVGSAHVQPRGRSAPDIASDALDATQLHVRGELRRPGD